MDFFRKEWGGFRPPWESAHEQPQPVDAAGLEAAVLAAVTDLGEDGDAPVFPMGDAVSQIGAADRLNMATHAGSHGRDAVALVVPTTKFVDVGMGQRRVVEDDRNVRVMLCLNRLLRAEASTVEHGHREGAFDAVLLVVAHLAPPTGKRGDDAAAGQLVGRHVGGNVGPQEERATQIHGGVGTGRSGHARSIPPALWGARG